MTRVDPSGEFAIAAVPLGLKALAGFLTAAGAGLLTSGLITQVTQYFMGMLALQVCLPQLTNLFNSLDHGLDQTLGPRPQPIPGWAGGGGIAVPVPISGNPVLSASHSNTESRAGSTTQTQTRRGSGGCRTTGNESDMTIGRLAHLLIQDYFVRRFGPGCSAPYYLPGYGQADAVILDEGSRYGGENYAGIYEIKPRSWSENTYLTAMATRQRDRYIEGYNQLVGPAGAGTYWAPRNEVITAWPLDPRQNLVVNSYYSRTVLHHSRIRGDYQVGLEGLVFYHCQ